MARIHQRISTIPDPLKRETERAIAASARKRPEDLGLDPDAEFIEIAVPTDPDGPVHRVRVRAFDLGVA